MLGHKILIADDEDYILRVVSFKLRAAGYRVTTATCGASALQAAQFDRPDLLITDMQMPGLSGLDLCRSLCDGELVPAILLTARSHDLESAGAEMPPNLRRIMSKPFSPRQLVVAVHELLQEAA